MSAEDLARVQQAHHRRLLGLRETTAVLVGDTWDAYAGLDDVSAARFTAAAATVVDTATAQVSTLAVGYMRANDQLAGIDPDLSGLVPGTPTIRGGVPTVDVYHRSIVEARRMVANGATFDDAMRAGRARATTTAATDVSLANRAEIARGQTVRPWVVGYRRVLTGRSCAFCAAASTQRYRSADLMPLHPGCDCDVAEIIGTADPGRIINRDLLDQLKAAADETGTRRYYDHEAPYFVDEDGVVRHGKLERPDDGPARVVATDKVHVETVQHGELGPTLTDRKHATASVPDPAPEPRRSKAKTDDADVLAEARRRNVSPERVVEIREEKAQRRFLEDRARRAAEKSLSVESAEVREVATRFGVAPDEVLTARKRVADVRKVAREQAARAQADAVAELDRLGAGRIVNPPRVGARTDQGTAARRGEWDWLERVSDKEKARLSRQWYGGTQAPDQLAHNMSAALGRDLSTDEAIEMWLDLNRRSEAAGALRRGKLPSLDAYSGQIDARDIIAELADEGYDIEILFGDDLAAAGHIAGVEQQLVRDEALQYLGDAAVAVEGPAPYRMGFQTWEAEVRDLEADIAEGFADDVARRRYAELVPQYLDEPGLEFEDLYARIVSTARKAGEEVPDYARIPW